MVVVRLLPTETAAGSRDSIYNQAPGSSLQRATILIAIYMVPSSLNGSPERLWTDMLEYPGRLYRKPSHAQTRVTPGMRLVLFSAWLGVLVKRKGVEASGRESESTK